MDSEACKRLYDCSLEQLKALFQHKDFVDASSSISSAITSHCLRKFSDLEDVKRRKTLNLILSRFEGKPTWQTIRYADISVLRTEDDDKYNISKDQWKISEDLKTLCGQERLDTDVESRFVDIVQGTRNMDEVRIVRALCWSSNVHEVDLHFKFRHSVYSDGTKEIHISVLEEEHFFSIHAYVEDRQVYIMDSLGDVITPNHKFHVMLLLLHLDNNHKINKADWKISYVLDNPKQHNGYDCGVYMLKALECWVKRVRLPFSEDKVQNARHFLLSQVSSNNLSGSKK